MLRLQKLDSISRILNAHGVVIPDWQQGAVQPKPLPDELHVTEKGSITGKINILASNIYHKAAGQQPRHATAVNSPGHIHAAKAEFGTATDIHAVAIFCPACLQNLRGANHHSPGARCNSRCIPQMVGMTMRHQNIVAGHYIRRGSCQRIAGKKRIKQQFILAITKGKSRMAIIS